MFWLLSLREVSDRKLNLIGKLRENGNFYSNIVFDDLIKIFIFDIWAKNTYFN